MKWLVISAITTHAGGTPHRRHVTRTEAMYRILQQLEDTYQKRLRLYISLSPFLNFLKPVHQSCTSCSACGPLCIPGFTLIRFQGPHYQDMSLGSGKKIPVNTSMNLPRPATLVIPLSSRGGLRVREDALRFAPTSILPGAETPHPKARSRFRLR